MARRSLVRSAGADVGTFVCGEGPNKGQSPHAGGVTWAEAPKTVVAQFPYVMAIEANQIEIHDAAFPSVPLVDIVRIADAVDVAMCPVAKSPFPGAFPPVQAVVLTRNQKLTLLVSRPYYMQVRRHSFVRSVGLQDWSVRLTTDMLRWHSGRVSGPRSEVGRSV